jgi:hypothetical protein
MVPIDVEMLSISIPYYDDTLRNSDFLNFNENSLYRSTLLSPKFRVPFATVDTSINEL